MSNNSEAFRIPAPLVKSWQKLQESRRNRLSARQVQRLAEIADEIWHSYTKDRRGLNRLPLTSPDFALAYHLAFHLPNMARQLIPLTRLRAEMLAWLKNRDGDDISILDIGCGSGASSMAIAHFLDSSMSNPAKMTFQLYDRSNHLLRMAEEGIKSLQFKSPPHITTCNMSIGRDVFKPLLPDHNGLFVVCLSYTWNELAKNKQSRADLLNLLRLAHQRQGPTWFFLSEPSSEHQAIGAMELRNELTHLGWNSIYPCPNNKPCPMLGKGKDWCFSELPFQAPLILDQWLPKMDRSQKILGCSSYWFTNHVEPMPRPASSRIVGRPRQGRRAWVLACGQDGIQKKEVFHKLPLRIWAERQPRGIPFTPKKPTLKSRS